MKKIILLLVIALNIGACSQSDLVKPKVKIGQTWVVINKDPFASKKTYLIKVLDIKGDYAKVEWDGYITSTKIDVVSCCDHILIK